jgi:glyoxylase I family protein
MDHPAEDPMPLISDLHHASLIVADTARALRFYQGLLGLALDPRRPDLGYPGAWLQVGSCQIHLLELPNPDPVAGRPAHGGRDRHVALAVPDLDPVLARLTAAGVACTTSRSGRRALFCRDPDGNALEFIECRGEPRVS